MSEDASRIQKTVRDVLCREVRAAFDAALGTGNLLETVQNEYAVIHLQSPAPSLSDLQPDVLRHLEWTPSRGFDPHYGDSGQISCRRHRVWTLSFPLCATPPDLPDLLVPPLPSRPDIDWDPLRAGDRVRIVDASPHYGPLRRDAEIGFAEEARDGWYGTVQDVDPSAARVQLDQPIEVGSSRFRTAVILQSGDPDPGWWPVGVRPVEIAESADSQSRSWLIQGSFQRVDTPPR